MSKHRKDTSFPLRSRSRSPWHLNLKSSSKVLNILHICQYKFKIAKAGVWFFHQSRTKIKPLLYNNTRGPTLKASGKSFLKFCSKRSFFSHSEFLGFPNFFQIPLTPVFFPKIPTRGRYLVWNGLKSFCDCNLLQSTVILQKKRSHSYSVPTGK